MGGGRRERRKNSNLKYGSRDGVEGTFAAPRRSGISLSSFELLTLLSKLNSESTEKQTRSCKQSTLSSLKPTPLQPSQPASLPSSSAAPYCPTCVSQLPLTKETKNAPSIQNPREPLHQLHLASSQQQALVLVPQVVLELLNRERFDEIGVGDHRVLNLANHDPRLRKGQRGRKLRSDGDERARCARHRGERRR